MKCIFPGCEREATARLADRFGATLSLTDTSYRAVLAYHCDEHVPIIEERIAMLGIGGNDSPHFERLPECTRSA